MNGRTVACTKCATPLPEALLHAQDTALACPHCQAQLLVTVFPALFRPLPAGPAAQPIVIEGEAGCFYHPQKQALIPCDNCGRFLCAVCDVEFNGRHLCPNCLQSGSEKGRLPALQHRRTLFDNVVLSLAVWPLLMWPFTLVTAPAALFLAIRWWKMPCSVLPRTKIRYILAMILATLQIAAWVMALYILIWE